MHRILLRLSFVNLVHTTEFATQSAAESFAVQNNLDNFPIEFITQEEVEKLNNVILFPLFMENLPNDPTTNANDETVQHAGGDTGRAIEECADDATPDGDTPVVA